MDKNMEATMLFGARGWGLGSRAFLAWAAKESEIK